MRKTGERKANVRNRWWQRGGEKAAKNATCLVQQARLAARTVRARTVRPNGGNPNAETRVSIAVRGPARRCPGINGGNEPERHSEKAWTKRERASVKVRGGAACRAVPGKCGTSGGQKWRCEQTAGMRQRVRSGRARQAV